MHRTRHIISGVSQGLEWVYASTEQARGVVFAPPLIGGHAVQQVRALRQLLHRRFNLFSFNYAGHGQSAGRFCLQASLDNAQHMLDLSLRHSSTQRLPVFGVASCFAAIPLLHAVRLRCEPLHKIVLINAVPNWRLAKAAGHFLDFWRQSDQPMVTWNGLVQVMREYRDDLLPGLIHRHRAFGMLQGRHVRWARVLYELFSQCVVPSAAVRRTPVLCAYGRQDHLLRQIGFSDWSDYEAQIRAICSKVRFKPLNGDHFLSSPEVRGQLIDDVARFLTD